MAAVRKRGSTLSAIGRGAGLSPKSIGWCLIRPHRRANAAIAAFLGLSLNDLWPQWFDQSGNSIAVSSMIKPRAGSVTQHGRESSLRSHPSKTAA